jgi:hypothetical protein
VNRSTEKPGARFARARGLCRRTSPPYFDGSLLSPAAEDVA